MDKEEKSIECDEDEEGMDFQPSQYTIFSNEYSQYRSSNDQVEIEDLDSDIYRDMFSEEFSQNKYSNDVLIEDLGSEDSPEIFDYGGVISIILWLPSIML